MSESKTSESKSSDSKYGADDKSSPAPASFVNKIQEFCMSTQLEREFENFAKAHTDVFQASVDLKDGDEHPLSFHNVYREYLDVFEKKIEKFAVGVSLLFLSST
jgi:hypothetical protein